MTNKIRARHQFKRGNDDCKEHVEKAADFYANYTIFAVSIWLEKLR